MARWAEGFAAGLIASLLGLLNPADPAFAGSAFLPQSLASVLAASLLGAGPGALAIAGTAIGSVALQIVAPLIGLPMAKPELSLLFNAARIPLAATMGAVLAAGWLRDASERSIANLMRRFRDLVRRNGQLMKMNEALTTVNEEFERRISGQRDSVSALYSQISKLDSLDLDRVVEALMDTVQAFSQASVAAIYEYDAKAEILVRRASLGSGVVGAEMPDTLSLDKTVEGWVFRNNRPYTLRKAEEYLNLAHIDYQRSVVAYPIRAGNLPWGVLNIEEMPFYRYNPTTEKNLEIVIELADSYIKKADDFRDRVLRRPRNAITGLPGYGELLRLLGEELEKRSGRGLAVSLVIVELLGFEELVFAHSGVKAFGLLKEFAEAITAGKHVLAFHAREDGQIAIVLPDTEREGASLFCLGISELAGERDWLIDEQKACFETAFGFSSFGGAATGTAKTDPEAMVVEAESLLARSKTVISEHGGGCE